MLPTPSVYGVVCTKCAGGIRLVTIPSDVHQPRFEGASQLPLTCPHCKSRRAYSTASIVHLVAEESKFATR